MNKPKIAFVIPTLGSGGAERVVSTLCNTLVEFYSVHIICLIKTTPFYKIHSDVKICYCIDKKNSSVSTINAIKNNYKLIKKIKKIAALNEIDLLISFITSANVLTIIAGKLLNIPVIVSERNNPEKDYLPKMWRTLRNLLFPLAKLIVVQTEDIKNFYEKKVDKNKVAIIPNPISSDFIISPSYEECSVSKENIILNVGRLNPQKAQHILIKAFANSENLNWKLYIVGAGVEQKKLEVLIENLKLKKKVFLLGKVKDIQKVYQKSKIFAFSSLFEGSPNALIEAMHFGLACVSTDCPTGPSDLINNGKNGFLINVNDTNALTEKLNILMSDKDLRISFGKNAQSTVSEFDASNISNKWSFHIDQCLNNT
ncbi:glycosyltransferase family 4 protein [Allomuricauda sp. F6463D]|uniref:glycosyltransferase family 4 protein n=1 Tax=Allomuricauda sp. F6463D TaxID=2926409 RepID=UPI001FF2718C|nr:glycosyltransferase family 4 protein [Muricauda sp. F6463D]MCK0159326.1 glycosyltransferase family 4 protein [Muricauda sp. F6463D]